MPEQHQQEHQQHNMDANNSRVSQKFTKKSSEQRKICEE
jgi:hypothetical protein